MTARVFGCSLLARFHGIIPPHVNFQSTIRRSIGTRTSVDFGYRNEIARPHRHSALKQMSPFPILGQQFEYDRSWWREVIIYQVYVHSFKDSNADGIGDLKGAIQKVPYLKKLGIDVVWLTPIYESPLKDMGYDISNYERINPLYGTLEDWQTLLQDLHKRDMRLIMDLVVNHTSDQHPWFKESRSGRDNPKHDWYHWMDPKYDEEGNREPPNNWGSVFGGELQAFVREALGNSLSVIGPAWSWDEGRQQYCRAHTPSLWPFHS